MDLASKETAWWKSLTMAQREEAALVHDAVPAWMVESMAAHGLLAVGADLAGHSYVSLMPTAVRDFIAGQVKQMPHRGTPDVEHLRGEVERLLAAAFRHDAELNRTDELHMAETRRRDQLHIDETDRRDQLHIVETDRLDQLHVADVSRRDQLHLDEMALLARAIESRDTIGQAKGIIIVTTRCTADEAFQLMRKQSQLENRKLLDVANEIVRRAQRPSG